MNFSVVIPVYNRSESLKRAIHSLLEQSYTNFEVLIVDDGSSQIWASKIVNVVSEFSDSRLKLIIHPQNLNGAAARNSGIVKSTGDYICFLDSDDAWAFNKLEVLNSILTSTQYVQKEVLIHNQYINVENSVKSPALPTLGMKKGESVAHYSFVTNNVGGIQSSTICISSELAKKTLFNDELKGHQDWDFCLRVGNVCDNFIFVNQALTLRYKDGADSVANSLDWKFSMSFLRLYRKYFTHKEAAYFMLRVIFPKAKQVNSLGCLLNHFSFWESILIKPSLLIDFFTMHKQQKKVLKRLDTLFLHCNNKQYKKIIVWGLNNYSELIIQKSGVEIDIIAILDSKSPALGGEFMGVPMWSITNIDIDILNSCDVLVLATDVHQSSMREQLQKIVNNKVKNVIDF